jgi:GH15 family glucan-1,4-alpha-glucosidase
MSSLLDSSIKQIKSMQLPNGGILATKSKGGYPYVYTRDAVFVAKALNVIGETKRAEKYFYFMEKHANVKNYKEIFQRYTDDGHPSVTRKNENDNEGLLLHGIYFTYLHNKKTKFLEDMWQLVEDVVALIFKYSKSGLLKTDESIHEFRRLEKGYEIWANCAGWRGLKDAAEIAKILNHKKQSIKWNKKADELEKNIKKKLWNKKTNLYVKNKKYPNAPDMSQLAPFYFGLDTDRTRLRNTMKYLRKNLWEEELGGFRRFRKFEICDDWHWYTGGSGSWIVLTCWAARFYQELNDKNKYKESLNWITTVGKKSNGLLPEHIALKKEYEEWKKNEIEFNERILNEMKLTEKNMKKFGEKDVVYWANPLAWAHAEYILLKKEKN